LPNTPPSRDTTLPPPLPPLFPQFFQRLPTQSLSSLPQPFNFFFRRLFFSAATSSCYSHFLPPPYTGDSSCMPSLYQFLLSCFSFPLYLSSLYSAHLRLPFLIRAHPMYLALISHELSAPWNSSFSTLPPLFFPPIVLYIFSLHLVLDSGNISGRSLTFLFSGVFLKLPDYCFLLISRTDLLLLLFPQSGPNFKVH